MILGTNILQTRDAQPNHDHLINTGLNINACMKNQSVWDLWGQSEKL